MAKCKNSGSGTESTNQALSKSAKRGSLMFVTVSITFIILTGPGAVVFFITESPDPIMSGIIYLLAHFINGVLFCVVGSRFRREVLDVLCCRKMNRSKRVLSMTISLPRISHSLFQTNVGNSTFTSELGTASLM